MDVFLCMYVVWYKNTCYAFPTHTPIHTASNMYTYAYPWIFRSYNTYICIYAHMHGRMMPMYVLCPYAYVYCMYAYVCTYICLSMYAYLCMYVRMPMYVCVCARAHLHIASWSSVMSVRNSSRPQPSLKHYRTRRHRMLTSKTLKGKNHGSPLTLTITMRGKIQWETLRQRPRALSSATGGYNRKLYMCLSRSLSLCISIQQ